MAWTRVFALKLPAVIGLRRGQDWALQIAVGMVYFTAGKLALFLPHEYQIATGVWPPAGLGLGMVLIFGFAIWPGLLAGAFLLKLTTLAGAPHHPLVLVAGSLCMASGETLEVLVGGWLAETYAKGRDAFRQPRTVAVFIAVTALAATIISASSNSLISLLVGFARWRELDDLWTSLWLGNMVGVILFAPLVVVWAEGRFSVPRRGRVLEAVILVLLLVAACDITFGVGYAGKLRGLVLSLIIVPVMWWAAFRFGERGTSAICLAFAAMALAGTLKGHGSFATGDGRMSLFLFQNCIAAITVMSLLLASEVSQRQRIDAGLRASEQRYRDLFNRNPQPLLVVDYDSLRLLAVNHAAVHHYGYTHEELLGMTLLDLQCVADRPALLESLNLARTGKDYARQFRQKTKDGRVIDVDLNRHNLDVDGREAAMVLVTDITEQKQAEQRLAAFSELGRRLSAASTPKEATQIIVDTADALFGWDSCRLELGPTPEGLMETVYYVETVNGRRSELSPPPGQGSPLTVLALTQGGQLSCTNPPAVAGSPHTVMAVPVRKETRVLGVLSLESRAARPFTQADLSAVQALADHCAGALERIRVETALRESDQRLRLALAASRMGIWTMELQGKIRIASSPELDAIFGLNPGEFDGSEAMLFEMIHPEDRQLARAAIARALQREDEYELEFRILPRNRPVAWLLARGRSCFDGRGEPCRLIGVAFDITARKEAEHEVLRLNTELEQRVAERTAQLEAINRELESFSYSVSHDLRAPLRSIRGFSEVLLEHYGGRLDARGREFLQRACESSQHMDLLIDDLLKLSRIGRAELHSQEVDLSAMAVLITAQLREAEPKRAATFTIAPGLRAWGDERLLRIALENLLRNAWKFTANQPHPTIEFGETAGPPRAYFVRDNGAGFDMSYATKLFGVFQRLHSTAEFPGTGIGLATVQRILNRHGGYAWAEAAVNQGATFYFTLPSSLAAANTGNCAPSQSGAILRQAVTAGRGLL